jgi:hypothetical protein
MTHAQGGEGAHHAQNLVEVEPARRLLEPLETLGQAVAAAQIALIGNGQAQIVDAAAERIFEFAHGVLLNGSDKARRCASP